MTDTAAPARAICARCNQLFAMLLEVDHNKRVCFPCASKRERESCPQIDTNWLPESAAPYGTNMNPYPLRRVASMAELREAASYGGDPEDRVRVSFT